MRLLHLGVDNFGVFRGEHSFDLSPVGADDHARHLVLFSGHNGAGKSTLFQAIMVAIHGSLILGDRVSTQQYSDFLRNRLHRRSEDVDSRPTSEAGVVLTLRYVRSGYPSIIKIERRWQRSGRAIQEQVTVTQDGTVPDIDALDYQTWINDLIPVSVAPICFFDAERLDAVAGSDQGNGPLGETLSRILGLDLVQRLQDDLEGYTLRRGGTGKADRLSAEVLTHQGAVDTLQAQRDHLEAEARFLADEQGIFQEALAQQERRLASEGGMYARRRPELQERLEAVQKEIATIESQLQEMSGELLPFTLVPELCSALSKRLSQEAAIHRRQIAGALMHEHMSEVEEALQGETLWHSLDLSQDARQAIADRFLHLLQAIEQRDRATTQPLVHHLAESERDTLEGWITKALEVAPVQAQALGEELRALRAEQHDSEANLKRAPDDAALAPMHAEITRLKVLLVEGERQRTALAEKIGAVQGQYDEQARLRQRAHEQFIAAQAAEQQIVLAERSKLALRAYKDALTRQRLEALQDALVRCFNVVCRKEHLLETARISPEDYSVQLGGADGHTVNLADFSAGERQLYSLALLWALRQVTGRQLPLLIDTPMARLDEIHRQSLIHGYLATVSDQVVLFATDAEIDAGLLAQAEPYVARIYRLQYSPEIEETVVACDERPNLMVAPSAPASKKEVAYAV